MVNGSETAQKRLKNGSETAQKRLNFKNRLKIGSKTAQKRLKITHFVLLSEIVVPFTEETVGPQETTSEDKTVGLDAGTDMDGSSEGSTSCKG